MSALELVVATLAVVAPPMVLFFTAGLWYLGWFPTTTFKIAVGWSVIVLVVQNLLGIWALFGWQPAFAQVLMWLGITWIVPGVAVPLLVDPALRERVAERRQEQIDVETRDIVTVEDES